MALPLFRSLALRKSLRSVASRGMFTVARPFDSIGHLSEVGLRRQESTATRDMRLIRDTILPRSLDRLLSCELSHPKQPTPSGLNNSLSQSRAQNHGCAASQNASGHVGHTEDPFAALPERHRFKCKG